MYKTLEAEKIVATIAKLRGRIVDRFPESSLARLVADLEAAARETAARAVSIRRPLWWPRVFAVAVLALVVALVWYEVETVGLGGAGLLGWTEAIQTLEAALGAIVFVGAGVLFLFTLETRIKRGRALEVIHELRSMAHIIDMHQLTKDPERVAGRAAASAAPRLTPFELARYYDYCSEALSLTSKVAAVYMQGFADPVVLGAVDEVENLCTGLARKIWQKIMVLDMETGTAAEPGAAPPPRELGSLTE